MPFRIGADVAAAPIRLAPPIGVRGARYPASSFTVARGDGLVMFSDGLVERRGSTLDEGLGQLAGTLRRGGEVAASRISAALAPSDTEDDVTVLTLRRL